MEGVVECLRVEEDGEPILGTHRGPGLDVHMLAEVLGLVVSVLQGRVEHCLNQSKVTFILQALFQPITVHLRLDHTADAVVGSKIGHEVFRGPILRAVSK